MTCKHCKTQEQATIITKNYQKWVFCHACRAEYPLKIQHMKPTNLPNKIILDGFDDTPELKEKLAESIVENCSRKNNRDEPQKYEKILATLHDHLEQNKQEILSMDDPDDVSNRIDEIINHAINQNDVYYSEIADLQQEADKWLNAHKNKQ